MEKSNILNKQVIEQAVNEVVNSIRSFTEKELKQLLTSKNEKARPPIIPINNLGYIVGNYGIKIYNDCWYVTSIYNQDYEKIFITKLSAILYALAEKNRNYKLANEIEIYDSDIARIVNKVKYYKKLKNQAVNKKMRDLCTNRIIEFEYRLETKKNLLAKSLKMAKYFYL